MKTIEMAREAGGYVSLAYEHAGKLILTGEDIVQRFAELIRADEREIWAKDADWCIQNHLEHLIPERLRARGNT